MPTHETLDAIADAVIPMLLGITLVLPVIPTVRARTEPLRWYVRLIAALIVVYGLMFVDLQFELWPSFGADYSTHTALATALILLWFGASRPIFSSGIALLLAYAALMLYQGYHTVIDIVTTAGVIIALWIGIMRLTDRRALPAAVDTE